MAAESTNAEAAAVGVGGTNNDGAGAIPLTLRRRGLGLVGPAWTYDPSVEKPAGTVDLGTYVASVCVLFLVVFCFCLLIVVSVS